MTAPPGSSEPGHIPGIYHVTGLHERHRPGETEVCRGEEAEAQGWLETISASRCCIASSTMPAGHDRSQTLPGSSEPELTPSAGGTNSPKPKTLTTVLQLKETRVSGPTDPPPKDTKPSALLSN